MKFNKNQFLSSVSTGLEEEYRNEKNAERMRRERFQARFPKLSSFPLVNGTFGAVYRHGFSYVLVLLVSIVVFTAIKVPYLQAPFTGEHSMKYNTYVEPAVYMVQKDSMLWNQKKYVSDPVHNPEGIFPKFEHLPLMEWGLFLTYKLFPAAGIELKTRIFTHLIGVLTLLCAYRFFSGYFPKSFNLLFIGLVAMNPVFSFATYVTVLDSIVFLFMFISLRQISVYLERKRIRSLLWAGVWFGLGNAVKYPLFLWLAPIAFLFLYSQRNDNAGFFKDYGIYLFTCLLVTFATVLAFSNLISSPGFSLVLVSFLALLLLGIHRFLVKYDESIQRMAGYILSKKGIFVLIFALSVLAGIFLFRTLRLSNYADEFLTDSTLVGNYRLYKYMLFHQFKEYMTRNLFWIGLSGTALALLTRESAMRRVWVPFLFGSLVYWVAASKSIFFHIYYSLIIVWTLTFSAAYFIHFLLRNLKNAMQKSIVLVGFLALILPPVVDATTGRMQNFVDARSAVRFIQENTKPDEFLLFEGYLTPLSIYTGRGFVMPAVLANDTIRQDIRRIGFANTMRKYRIKYLFTPNDQPFFLDYAPLFEATNLLEPSGQNFNRNILIYKTIGISDQGVKEDLRQVEEIERKYKIREKFILEKQIGKMKFYSFKD
jgi:hypothetical protein